MSVEAQTTVEVAPEVKPVEATPTTAPTAATVAPTATETPAAEAAKPTETTTAPASTEIAKDEAVVEATPATEGTLGYKEPGFLKQFRFVKHFFWLSEEPLTKEALDSYIKAEKPEVAHSHAAWAQETGQGVLFYTKRAEDKAHPTGLIILADATNVTKVGTDEFSFKIGTHTHKFEATTSQERDSWIVAIEKIVSESKDLKEDIHGRESYKKTIEGYSLAPVVAAKKSPEPTSATPATTEPTAEPVAETETAAVDPVVAPVAAEEEKKTEKAEKAKKERSQSRKRFSLFGKKDEDKDLKKEEKAEKKAEKEHIKEEKKAEAEIKKEEAKAEHDNSKAVDAAEAAAVAAAPAGVVAAVEKHEEKKEEKAEEKAIEESSPTEKKAKRSSVFGSLFSKNKVTSPTTEKTEKEAAPAVPAKDSEVPAVSETAPVLDEPIENKPIDTAAVTAPVDAAEPTTAAPVTTEEATKETTSPVAETATTPKTEKKSFLAGLIKKPESKKQEHKEEKAAEEIAKDPVAAAAVEPTTTEAAPEVPVKDAEAPKEERPAREKRRTSLFGSLGTLKRKGDKSPAPATETAATEEGVVAEPKDTKREKSPLPSKLGGLFRKPSKAVKSEKPVEDVKTDGTATETKATETPATTEAAATTAAPESKIVGDVVPDELHTTVHDAVTTAPSTEVKATA